MAGLDIEEPVEFAYRDNYLDFITKRKGTDTGITLFEDIKGDLGCYTVKGYCVTDGQDPDKCIRDMDYYIVRNSLFFRCGRHKTEKVGSWWKREYPAAYNTYGSDNRFNSVNFAMRGDLRLNLVLPGSGANGEKVGGESSNGVRAFVTLKDIGIAQTSWDGRNRWVLGRKHYECNSGILYYSVPYVKPKSDDPADGGEETGKWVEIMLYRSDEHNGVNEVTISAQIKDSGTYPE